MLCKYYSLVCLQEIYKCLSKPKVQLIFSRGFTAFASVAKSDHPVECSSSDAEEIARKGLKIIDNFVTEEEEQSLLNDIEPKWKRLKYQETHWDNAIQGYRETKNVCWSDSSSSIISRIRSSAFEDTDVQQSLVHVLDLSPSGFIKPHVDSVKFCGQVITGLSLLSPCVMKFVNEDDPNVWFIALLKRRSLYVMRDRVRYDFSHEVLPNEDSYFKGEAIPKGRRISILCRSEPEYRDDSNIFQSIVIPLDENEEV